MKKSFIFFLSLFFVSVSFCQQSFIVSGKIINAENGEPLQGASVFAQNTTLGTATDAMGNYKLYLPDGGYELVVTFTGYTTESKRVSVSNDATKDINFLLKQKQKEMADVTVVATTEVKDGWLKYGSFFLDNFIGKTTNSKSCSLRNPELLKFFFSKKRNRLKVIAAEPLIIENKALGYNIKYALDSFTYDYATDVTLYTGFPLFEEQLPASEDQKQSWVKARTEAYSGSTLHFMRTLFNRRLKEEDFEIQFLVKTNDRESAILLKDMYGALNFKKDDSLQTVTILPNQPNVGIIYKTLKPDKEFIAANPDEPAGFQFSTLSFKPGDPIIIEQNGYYYDQNDLAISGYWTWDKIADLLPYDYEKR